ncbi:MAG: hypothetical protein QOC96_3231 [Acidobacteriota bacterium]|jgi:hypothetical protein|nr:hypothetical protein [Acidobacteriota bacterium]
MGRLLYDELKKENEKLSQIFDDIYKYSLDIWSRPQLLEFTEHGELHTQQVEQNLDDLTRPLQKLGKPENGADELSGALTPEEIFVLLSSCCLHDIGMQYDKPEARKYHAEYSCTLIAASSVWEDLELRKITLSIEDKIAREAIALVARGHWFDYARELEERDFICNYNKKGRLKLLGMLLAMADLLEQSNARAYYFHKNYRLLELDSAAELHHQKHERVKGIEIVPKDEKIRNKLQFQVTWQDDSNDTHEISQWLTVWLSSQWQQIQKDLEAQSLGTIGWARPWFKVEFGTPLREFKALKKEVRNVLRAERAEQTRVDREPFVNRFRQALKSRRAALFRFPSDAEMDGVFVSRWCAAQANATDGFEEIADIVIGGGGNAYKEISGIIAALMKKWQPDLRIKAGRRKALEQLKSFLSAEKRSLTSIISTGTDKYNPKLLDELLTALMLRPKATPPVARICLLLTPGAEGPPSLEGGQVNCFDKSLLTQQDVEVHLQTHWGYDESEGQRIARNFSEFGHLKEPGMVYSNIEKLCGLLSGND